MQAQYQRLSDWQWEAIKELLPTEGKRKYSLRVIVDAIFWCLRIGNQWQNLSDSFPKWELVYYYFRKWQTEGTLERLGKKDRPRQFNIDSQSVKVASFISAATGVEGNKKINGGKRDVITDTLGLVWGVVVEAANKADGAVAERVVAPLCGYMHRMKKILAEAAYEKVFMEWVTENLLGVDLEITPNPAQAEGFLPVRWRWISERAFGLFNFFRRLDKDHQKTTKSAEAWVLWQNCQLILNRIC